MGTWAQDGSIGWQGSQTGLLSDGHGSMNQSRAVAFVLRLGLWSCGDTSDSHVGQMHCELGNLAIGHVMVAALSAQMPVRMWLTLKGPLVSSRHPDTNPRLRRYLQIIGAYCEKKHPANMPRLQYVSSWLPCMSLRSKNRRRPRAPIQHDLIPFVIRCASGSRSGALATTCKHGNMGGNQIMETLKFTECIGC